MNIQSRDIKHIQKSHKSNKITIIKTIWRPLQNKMATTRTKWPSLEQNGLHQKQNGHPCNKMASTRKNGYLSTWSGVEPVYTLKSFGSAHLARTPKHHTTLKIYRNVFWNNGGRGTYFFHLKSLIFTFVFISSVITISHSVTNL